MRCFQNRVERAPEEMKRVQSRPVLEPHSQPCPSLTVIVSIYGRYSRDRVLRAVLARWRAQTISPEIILSEQVSHQPQWAESARALGVRHVVSRPDAESGDVRYDIGRVRNAGIAAARTTLLYMTDADIYPLRANYLERLCRRFLERPGRVWYRPRMYRLLAGSIDDFLSFVSRERSDLRLPAGNGCLCSFAGGRLQLEAEERMRLDGWSYVCTPEELALMKSDAFDDQHAELLTKPDFHWGGTLLSREMAYEVAGYAEGYVGWGYEDEDFHTKLAGCFDLERIPTQEVLHFEHSRAYNDRQYAENGRRFRQRSRQGAQAMIEADRSDPRSFLNQHADLRIAAAPQECQT